MRVQSLIFIFFVVLFVKTNSRNTSPMKKNPKEAKQANNKKTVQPSVQLDYDKLPNLIPLLEELNLSHFLKDFIKMGVTETRHMVRLKAMDFQIMLMDWNEFNQDDVKKLKDKILDMIKTATIIEEPKRPDLDERSKLRYGRLYINEFVQSFEYVIASFGAPPPLGAFPLVLASQQEYVPLDGCVLPTNLNLTNKFFVIQRGNCTFLTKALAAHNANAAALIVVNNEDQIESPSSGLGVDPKVKESQVLSLNNLAIISIANTSWAKLESTLKFSNSREIPNAHIVPLKCGSGGICAPVTLEEKSLLSEVTWGIINLFIENKNESSKSFEFITSNFGGRLPLDDDTLLSVVLADPLDACEPLKNNGDDIAGAVVVINRGNCRFDVKALNAQAAGARLALVIEADDNSLQRIGGNQPTAGYVGIPSILASAPCGSFINASIAKGVGGSANLKARLTAGVGSTVMDDWIDIAYTEWSTTSEDQIMQIEGLIQKYNRGSGRHVEIVDWLRRRERRISAGGSTSAEDTRSEL